MQVGTSKLLPLFLAVGSAAALLQLPAQAASAADKALVDRGRYLVATAGCNDCHTPGYPQSGGRLEEKVWLTGDRLGWRGPWGTTYAPNLRLLASKMTETQWMARARSEMRPPMSWVNLRDLRDGDVRAIYRWLKYMGPAGEPAPAYLPPDQIPPPPFVQFPMKK